MGVRLRRSARRPLSDGPLVICRGCLPTNSGNCSFRISSSISCLICSLSMAFLSSSSLFYPIASWDLKAFRVCEDSAPCQDVQQSWTVPSRGSHRLRRKKRSKDKLRVFDIHVLFPRIGLVG